MTKNDDALFLDVGYFAIEYAKANPARGAKTAPEAAMAAYRDFVPAESRSHYLDMHFEQQYLAEVNRRTKTDESPKKERQKGNHMA